MVCRGRVWLWMGSVLLLLLSGRGIAGELTGVVQWAQRVELGTPQSGIVVEVPVTVGELVQKGQLLVQLESRGLQARVRRAEAEFAKARMERAEGQRELERAKELYERTLLSNHDLEQAKIAFAAVNSRYQAANATQVEARLELEQSSVKAPFEGVVLHRNVEVGQTVVSALQSAPLITLAATHLMRVNAEATPSQLERLQVKQKVEVIASDKRFRGEITFIGLEPLAGSGEPHYPVYVEFATEGNMLRAGSGAKVITP